MNSSIEIYKTADGLASVDVKFVNDTVWLNLNQISELFKRDKSVISRHINNIFREGELIRNSVVAKYATTAKDGKTYQIDYFNLDVIISTGYRIKSQRGTQFRIWATSKLKDYLIRGYNENKNRLKELKQSIKIIHSTISIEKIDIKQIKEVIDVLTDYAFGLDILDGYDHQNLEIIETSANTKYEINYKDVISTIEALRMKFGGGTLFGNEKDQSFKSSISTINQTFGGIELYPSIEEKAANLLYFVVKNHSFSDGNKRIAAWLFVWYLNQNDYLYDENGNTKIANNALASITLMVALSKPDEKELMIKVIINTINKLNVPIR